MSFWMIITTAGLLASCLLFSLCAQSVRTISRGGLWEICDRRHHLLRFQQIIRQRESAFLACEMVAMLSLVALTLSTASWIGPRVQENASIAPVDWAALVALAFAALFVRLVIPWSLARIVGDQFLERAWPMISLCQLFLSPVTLSAHRLDRLGHRAAGQPEPLPRSSDSLGREIQFVVEEGQREGLIEPKAGTMIRRVIEMREEDIGSVMMPRTDMVTLSADVSIEEARRKFIEAGHSRIPLVGESIDDIQGILYAKDLLVLFSPEQTLVESIRDLARPPFYVPITASLDTVLETMKHKHNHMAIVVDEYGGVAGLVTLEDVLEEIVGDIVDEFDSAEETGISQSSETQWEVAGWVHLDDLNEEFGFELPEDEDFDTVAGFIVNELARVPEIGEELLWEDLRFTILDADLRKVNRLRIEKRAAILPPL